MMFVLYNYILGNINNIITIFVAVIIGLLLFNAIYAFTLGAKINHSKLKSLLPLIPGKIKVSRENLFAELDGRYGDKNIKIKLETHSAGEGPDWNTVDINLSHSFPFVLHIYPKPKFAFIGKKLSLVEAIDIGNPEFDYKYMIVTKSKPEVLQFLNLEKQKIIYRIFVKGFSELTLTPEGITLNKTFYSFLNCIFFYYQTSSYLKLEIIREVLEDLMKLTK